MQDQHDKSAADTFQPDVEFKLRFPLLLFAEWQAKNRIRLNELDLDTCELSFQLFLMRLGTREEIATDEEKDKLARNARRRLNETAANIKHENEILEAHIEKLWKTVKPKSPSSTIRSWLQMILAKASGLASPIRLDGELSWDFSRGPRIRLFVKGNESDDADICESEDS